MYKLADTDKIKVVTSSNFNMFFDKTTGFTTMHGSTLKEDPLMCEFGPIIADIEVTTICEGIADAGPCKFCYKSNTSKGHNMSLDTFKMIIDKLPKTLTQVALGADAKCISNPDIWDMMAYARSKGVVPNITVADIDEETAEKLGSLCGAVAVSNYGDEEVLTRTLKNLHKHVLDPSKPLKQVNIHQMVSRETWSSIYYLCQNFDDIREYVNAVVFLSLKQRGRGAAFNQMKQESFTSIIEKCLRDNIPFGFDSCGACKVALAFRQLGKKPPLHLIESCESTLFSCYFNAEGNFYPCSFNEEPEYAIHISSVNNFIKDLWYSPSTCRFRHKLIMTKDSDGLCSCPTYEV